MNFNQRVWETCRKIPKGKVATYKSIAERLKTKAYRAVGNALHVNPYAPEVPCHRVVNSNGVVGGFARGQRSKIKLLKEEGIDVKGGKVVNFEKRLHKF